MGDVVHPGVKGKKRQRPTAHAKGGNPLDRLTGSTQLPAALADLPASQLEWGHWQSPRQEGASDA